jgi:hypothetical protein
VESWLQTPQRSFRAAVDCLDELGAMTVGAMQLDPEAKLTSILVEQNQMLAKKIEQVSEKHGASMLDAAMAASAKIASNGVWPGADDALISLSDVVGMRLKAALAGELLEQPSVVQVQVLEQSVAETLGKMFQTALSRSHALQVAPEFLDVPLPLLEQPRLELVLHDEESTMAADRVPFEVLKGVQIRIYQGLVDVELEEDAPELMMLVPMFGGEPGDPCRRRGGNHNKHFLFEILEPSSSEGYALVLDDRIIFLKIRDQS